MKYTWVRLHRAANGTRHADARGAPLNNLEDEQQSETTWRLNYASVAGQVLAVLEDQAARGQVLKYSEAEAAAQYPDFVVVSLGATRKDKLNGVVTARVLLEGTNGFAVNTRTRIRVRRI